MKKIAFLIIFICTFSCAFSQLLEWEITKGGVDEYGEFYQSHDTLFMYKYGGYFESLALFSTNNGKDWYDYTLDTLRINEEYKEIGKVKFRTKTTFTKQSTAKVKQWERSEDNGITWEALPSFGDNEVVLTITSKGITMYVIDVITQIVYSYTTADTGKNWTQHKQLPFKCSSGGIKSYNNNTFYTTVTDSVLISIDNGVTFSGAMYNGQPLRLINSTIVITGNNVIAESYDGLMISKDGGLTWHLTLPGQRLDGNTNTRLRSNGNTLLYAKTEYHQVEKNGFRLIFKPSLYYSSDTGNSWTIIDSTSKLIAFDFTIVNSKQFVVITNNGLRFTTNTGLTWRYCTNHSTFQKSQKLVSNNDTQFLLSFAESIYNNNTNSWDAYSTVINPTAIYKSEDTVFLASAWIGGLMHPVILYSLDNGANYNYIKGRYAHFSDCNSIVPHKGLVFAQANKKLIQNTDTNKLEFVTSNLPDLTTDVYFLHSNESSLFIGSDVIYKSDDKGITWKQLHIPKYKMYYFIKAMHENTMYVVNDDGDIYRSLNNGAEWKKLTLRSSNPTRTKMSALRNYVLFVGYDTVSTGVTSMMFSTNYGESWNDANHDKTITSVAGISINSLGVFASTNKGILRADLYSNFVPGPDYPILDVFMYPNPANEKVAVEIPDMTIGGILTITDILGRIQKSISVKSGNTTQTISCSDLANGVYTITYQNGIATYSRTMIVAR